MADLGTVTRVETANDAGSNDEMSLCHVPPHKAAKSNANIITCGDVSHNN
jgi:hypothetical protein